MQGQKKRKKKMLPTGLELLLRWRTLKGANKNGKVLFSWANMVIILFLEPRFVKYEKHLLMWKLISVSCTLSRLYFFYRNCPSRYPGQQPISARAEIEPVVLCKIKYWASHKNTLGDRPFILPFSHLVPIPLIFLQSVTKAKQRFPQENPSRSTVLSSLSLILAPIPLICLHSVTKAKQKIP